MCLFLTNLEIPIVTTALVGMTMDLGGFSQINWIISAYLLGYVGMDCHLQPKWMIAHLADSRSHHLRKAE